MEDRKTNSDTDKLSLSLTDDAAFVLNQFFLLKDKLNHALHVNRSGYRGRHSRTYVHR